MNKVALGKQRVKSSPVQRKVGQRAEARLSRDTSATGAARRRTRTFPIVALGHPITDINMRLPVPRIDKLIREVIETLQIKDVESQDSDGRWWSVRLRPYKTTDQKIDGAVVAFVDIDVLRNPPKGEGSQ